eukprot:6863243-Pyramimonas_sp.AAC.1
MGQHRPRAREEFCMGGNRKVAMMAWQLKRTRERWPIGFPTSHGFLRKYRAVSRYRLRAHARDRQGCG